MKDDDASGSEHPPWTKRRHLSRVARDTLRDFGLVMGALGLVIIGALLAALITGALMIFFGPLYGGLFFMAVFVAIGWRWLVKEFR